MRRKPYRYFPRPDQMDPERVRTERVQVWRNDVMVTALMTREEAQQGVASRRFFVISSQAIGALHEDGYSIA